MKAKDHNRWGMPYIQFHMNISIHRGNKIRYLAASQMCDKKHGNATISFAARLGILYDVGLRINVPMAKSIKFSDVDSVELLRIHEKLRRWERCDNTTAPLSEFQRDACSDLATDVASKRREEQEFFNSKHEKSDYPVKTKHQFLELLHRVSEEEGDPQIALLKPLLDELIEKRDKYDDLLKKLENVTGRLNELKNDYEDVSKRTNSLYLISNKPARIQTELSKKLTELDEKLRPFHVAERLGKKLDSSAVSVTSEEFVQVLNELDECFQYFTQYGNYRESANYLMLTRQSLSRALGDVKAYICSVLENCRHGRISKASLMDVENSATAAKTGKFAVQYGRFQTAAPRLKHLITQLENRRPVSNEYDAALEEILQYYVATREPLIVPSVLEEANELTRTHAKDFCTMMRSLSSHLTYVCRDEYKLYEDFFTQCWPPFEEYMESVCGVLYDIVRPLVVHMKHMETLAEFSTILRVEILQDQVGEEENLKALGNVVEQLLHDVQERLVFRSHLYFKTDIAEYKPSAGDLAYPEKLEMMRSIAEEIQLQESTKHGSSSSNVGSVISLECRNRTGGMDLHGMWYPSVRRTLVCLSRLYRCVEKSIFQGMAQEAVACCVSNLREAAGDICKRKSDLDGSLFEIKHLLVMREQIAPFQADFTSTELSLDLDGFLKRSAGDFFTLGSNNALLELITTQGSTLLRERYLDSRKSVDSRLKEACEFFIGRASEAVVDGLNVFIRQAREYLGKNGKAALAEQPFAEPVIIRDLTTEALRKVKRFVPDLQEKMDLYLCNPDTQFILFRPIKNNIVGAFSNMQALLDENYENEARLLIGCPTPEQVMVLLSSIALCRGNANKIPKD